MDDQDAYRYVAGVLVGGVPLLLALVVGYVPAWRRGFTIREVRPWEKAWPLWVIGAALALAVLGTIGFLLGDSGLLGEDFAGGLRDGALIIGVLGGGAIILLMLLARRIVGTVRGDRVPRGPQYLTFNRLRKMAAEELDTLRGRLDGTQRSAECLRVAEALVERADEVHSRSVLGSGECLAAVVVCRAALTGADGSAPFCWLNPLHGVASGSGVFPVGDPLRDELRPLCATCTELVEARAGGAMLRTLHTHSEQAYLVGGYFRIEGGGLDLLLKDADRALRTG